VSDRITITEFRAVTDHSAGRPAVATWDKLVERLTTFTRADDKRQVSGWAPATFEPVCACGDEKCPGDRGHRLDENVVKLYALTFDIDKKPDGTPLDQAGADVALGQLGRLGLRGVVHTTFSHAAPTQVALRAVIALSRPVRAAEWSAFWTAAVAHVGIHVEPSCKNPARFWFLPSAPPTGEPWFRVLEGSPLDVDAIIAKSSAKIEPRSNGKASPSTYTPRPDAFDVDAFMAATYPGVESFTKRDRRCWDIECPWEHEHTPGSGGKHDTVVSVSSSDELGFSCRHSHCVDRHWRDFRKHHEPGWTPFDERPTNGKKLTDREPPPDLDESDHVFADRDAEPPPSPPAPETSKPPPTWHYAPPLATWLGDAEEPTDDDAEDWLIRDLVARGEQSINAGSPMVGKTTFEMLLALLLVLGQGFGKFENCLGRPARVLLVLGEDGRRRLIKKLWRLARGLFVTPHDERILAGLRLGDQMLRVPEPKSHKRFVDEMLRWKPDLIVIDSLSRSMIGNQNDISDVTEFTTAWRELTVASGAAVRYLHHTNKRDPDEKRRGDPFDAIRGSRELLAAPRHAMVMERLGEDDSGLTSVHMRSNLSLRRKSFALGYEESEQLGKTVVRLHDRGELETVAREAKEERKERKEAEAKQARASELERRRTIALEIVNRAGAVSTRALAEAAGVKSAQTVAPVLEELVRNGVLRRDRTRGYVLKDEPAGPAQMVLNEAAQ
jgi:RecA-family ATPase